MPCLNGGTCQQTPGSGTYECICQSYFEGRNCQERVSISICSIKSNVLKYIFLATESMSANFSIIVRKVTFGWLPRVACYFHLTFYELFIEFSSYVIFVGRHQRKEISVILRGFCLPPPPPFPI